MKYLKDIDVRNKKVILRLDLNVSIKDESVGDDNKIRASLRTINYLLNKNCTIIIMSHLGKVKTIEDIKTNSLRPVRKRLSNLLRKKILFSETLRGKELEDLVASLKPKDILLLENTRIMDYPNNLESNCDDELSTYWSTLADIYIFDAFASIHRVHASTYGLASKMPHAAGFLVEKELEVLSKIKDTNKTLLLGGVKITDKISLIESLLPTSEKILIGGAMCATFLKSQGYNVGKTITDDSLIPTCKKLCESDKIILPVDVKVGDFDKEISKLKEDDIILDIGDETIDIFIDNLKNANLIVINGTVGKYEDMFCRLGTETIYRCLDWYRKDAIVLGGDAGDAARRFGFKPLYKSTGGGASLQYLSDQKLPLLELLEEE